MRLSEAIRLGSMLKPQCRGNVEVDGATCAMGAAFNATGINGRSRTMVIETFPVLVDLESVPCPACGQVYGLSRDGNVITHLNDSHWWTREQIADWVETIEPRETPAVHDDSQATNAVATPTESPVAVTSRS